MAHVEAGDEPFGLVRGFLAAGAGAVAASLWQADDGATSMLMERFYEIFNSGVSASEALRAAQISLRSRLPHPYFWAPFVLIGRQNVRFSGRQQDNG